MENFGEYIVYVDESGDYSLSSIDPSYPMFVLAFCIFRKSDYTSDASPRVQSLKFKHFGHDMVVLHERCIRKASGEFTFLTNREKRKRFLGDVSELMQKTEFTLIATAIRKTEFLSRVGEITNPYNVAMKFGLERVVMYISRRTARQNKITHVVFESRGKKEDGELELEFRRVCARGNYSGKELPLEIVFADKQSNSTGLQISDLVARPVGRHVLQPSQPNQAYEIIKEKFDRSRFGKINGYGLKVFP